MTKLNILHFNDVYRAQPFQYDPKSSETIDVCQYAALLDDLRKSDGLVLFSGDVFSPSVESSVTRGSHMVPVLNELAPDVALTGNHDFDFGYPHLTKLIKDTKFPWLLSNIIDTATSKAPEYLKSYIVLDRAGIRIGIIGLVEKEWIGTVSSWPANFKFQDMAEVGRRLSQELRDPKGEHKCDLIIALTHSRVPNDVQLAKDLAAFSPSAQTGSKPPFVNLHGVDIILGGHDHLYYVSRGVTSWEGYDKEQKVLGAESDKGDVLIVKSGTDFRDLSEMELELEDTPPGSVRRKVIKSLIGRRHQNKPGSKSSERLQAILKDLLSAVSSSLSAAVCKTTVELDLRSTLIRTTEMSSSNWFADVLRHAYDDAPGLKTRGGSDGVFICAGTLRGDSVYGPGDVTLGNILEILPFEDPLIVLELDGETIWAALEASLSTWPAQEGRFPVISGFRVQWNSSRKPGQRVLGVWQARLGAHHKDGEKVKRQKDGRTYAVVTREYMAQGHDGFTPLKGRKYLVDDESGQLTSTIVRRYLLGSQYVHKMARVALAEGKSLPADAHLHDDTHGIIVNEKERKVQYKQGHAWSRAADAWKRAAATIIHLHRTRTSEHYQNHLGVSTREHMSSVDCFDGARARCGAGISETSPQEGDEEQDLLIISPEVDGRLRDVERKQ